MTGERAPLRVVVIGAGVGGLGVVLGLARAGHAVTILERDDTPFPQDVEGAFDWDRRGAPQVRHAHGFTARLRLILRERFPDVLADLLAAGALERNLLDQLAVSDRHLDDDDLTILACRRSTYEWVLRRAVLASASVDFRVGVGVDGLVGSASPGAAPMITGVRLSDGGRIDADVVVATTGRRSDVPGWLAPFGVTVPETVVDAGIVYFSRFYRLRPGHELPVTSSRPFGSRAGLGFAGYECDNRTIATIVAARTGDAEMRAHLRDDQRYQATCELIPELAPVVDAERSEPITSVHLMTGLINRVRHFVDDAGEPLVHGFHAIGDAHTCTNPLYGRGCALALVQATLLIDAIAAHGADAASRARDYEEGSTREVEPWFHVSVMSDLARGQGRSGGTGPGGEAGGFRWDALVNGAASDPVLARAIARVANLLDTPDALLGDPAFASKLAAAVEGFDKEAAARRELLGATRLTREQILAVRAA